MSSIHRPSPGLSGRLLQVPRLNLRTWILDFFCISDLIVGSARSVDLDEARSVWYVHTCGGRIMEVRI